VHASTFINRFPPSEVAAKMAVSLGIGLIVGIEREWSNKDLGAKTFALVALPTTNSGRFSSDFPCLFALALTLCR
jgi:hypothetical protein